MTAVVIEADFAQWLRDNRPLAQRGAWPRYHAAFFDPPYAISFMSATWDTMKSGQHYQAWVKDWAEMLLDFMFPGALLVAFGGSRTYHRLACGIEDAGWEIADSLRVALPAAWVQGQGFPKSLNIGKAIDKAAGAEREYLGPKVYADGTIGHASNLEHAGWQRPWKDDPEAVKRNKGITAPATPEAAQWSGYGTALSPSHEAIVIARSPRGSHTYADLALTFGTGALNIDGARISTTDKLGGGNVSNGRPTPAHEGWHRPWMDNPQITEQKKVEQAERVAHAESLGRWPSNFALVHDERCTDAACVEGCPVKALGEQSGVSVNGGPNYVGGDRTSMFGNKAVINPTQYAGDQGTAARFYYCAKAGGFERFYPDADGHWQRIPHPTLKPVTLNEHICRLLKPPTERSRILIPFCGVGSEMLGAMLSQWTDITGIEQSSEYAAIARARLKWWSQFDSYDAAKQRYDSEQRGRAADAAKEAAGQLGLWDDLEDSA